MEKDASNSWRIYTGKEWKHSFPTREIALGIAKKTNCQLIGYALWNEELLMNTYIRVEEVDENRDIEVQENEDDQLKNDFLNNLKALRGESENE